MNYTENYNGVKIDVQSPNVDINEAVQAEIRTTIDKLSKFAHNINAADFYFKEEGHSNSPHNSVGVRLGIPGPDVFAEETGDNWVTLIKSVTDKLVKQLEKK